MIFWILFFLIIALVGLGLVRFFFDPWLNRLGCPQPGGVAVGVIIFVIGVAGFAYSLLYFAWTALP